MPFYDRVVSGTLLLVSDRDQGAFLVYFCEKLLSFS